jgi:hypothetical protein
LNVLRAWLHQGPIAILALAIRGCLILCSLPGASAGAGSMEQKARAEYEVRAAFLVTISKYTQWPDRVLPLAAGELVVGVLGEDTFGAALDAIQGERVQGRKVVVKRFQGPADLEACHVLYFPKGQERHLPALREKLAQQAVLTVGETPRFLELGGALYLFSESERLRFIVDQGALDQARLSVDSKALNLAKRVLNKHSERP